MNSDLAGIWNQAGNLTDYINGVGINYCPKAVIKDNKVSSTETTPYAWANWLTSGFRIDMSPGTTVCSNLASETGPYPNTAVNASMQIGDPFEFHGNCFPSTFKLNTMDNSTARGLYMGGMPIFQGNNSATNGTIIGKQFDAQLLSPWVFSFHTRDNFWGNMNGGFHTDYNNVDGTLNEFWMTYSTAGFNNNFQAIVNFIPSTNPQYSFQSVLLPNNPTLPCADPFINPVQSPDKLDAFDDIARDSILQLGGNDTSRYFGKEFLYAQMKADSTLYAYAVLAQFKDSMDQTNIKIFDDIKNALIFPIDSITRFTMDNIVSGISPENNIEINYKEVFELALNNPELKDSVYSTSDLNRLRTIARLCPFMDGSAVYTARVILHAFEPDSTYYNYCEFAKKPDRESAERKAKESKRIDQPNTINIPTEFVLIPNPNNGTFKLICSEEENIHLLIFDGKGGQIFEQEVVSRNKVVDIDVSNHSPGIYNLTVISSSERKNIRFVINK